MKTIKLNPSYLASKIGRLVYVHRSWMGGERIVSSYGNKITKSQVRKVLSLETGERKRLETGETWFPSRDKTIILREVKRNAKSIRIGCQGFSLTAINNLLSLF